MFEKKKDDDLKIIKQKIDVIGEALSELIKDMKTIKELIIPKTFTSTIKGFEVPEDYEKLKLICSDLTMKDETFKFEANDDDKEIYIYLEDKDQLHKKSMWLIKRTGIEGIKYTIK